jgi:hypothetical protein
MEVSAFIWVLDLYFILDGNPEKTTYITRTYQEISNIWLPRVFLAKRELRICKSFMSSMLTSLKKMPVMAGLKHQIQKVKVQAKMKK